MATNSKINKGSEVKILAGSNSEARDYVGQKGLVQGITPKLGYLVQFYDGQSWFYEDNSVKAV